MALSGSVPPNTAAGWQIPLAPGPMMPTKAKLRTLRVRTIENIGVRIATRNARNIPERF